MEAPMALQQQQTLEQCWLVNFIIHLSYLTSIDTSILSPPLFQATTLTKVLYIWKMLITALELYARIFAGTFGTFDKFRAISWHRWFGEKHIHTFQMAFTKYHANFSTDDVLRYRKVHWYSLTCGRIKCNHITLLFNYSFFIHVNRTSCAKLLRIITCELSKSRLTLIMGL